jgi:hypothetical protein
VILLAAMVCAASAQERKVRVFDAPVEAVWTAAAEVGKEAFLLDREVKEEGRMRLRAGPLRAYRFEIFVASAPGGRTRVELELHTRAQGAASISKDAWRNGERFLSMVAARLGRR